MKTLEKLLDLVGTCEVIDMTHPLEEEIPHWPTQPGVKFHTGMNYVEDGAISACLASPGPLTAQPMMATVTSL